MQSINAIALMDRALKSHPNNVRLLYARANAFSMMDPILKNVNATLQPWDAFLAAAPKDHPKVPAAHYRMATLMLVKHKQEECVVTKFVQCFEEGLAAERQQLPCFLPYDFPPKYDIEKMYMAMKMMGVQRMQQQQPSSYSAGFEKQADYNASNKQSLVFTDPQRKFLFCHQQEMFAQLEGIKQGSKNWTSFSSAPAKMPKSPSVVGLKEIKLAEMVPDSIYNGYVLEVQVANLAPNVLASVMLMVEDGDSRQVERLAIYNWPESENTSLLLKTFQRGRQLSIINPHLRIARDGQRMLRVESPAYVILGESPAAQSVCHCCGARREGMKKCARCQMVAYCSKECQQHDWTEFQHKMACKWLSKYQQ